MTKKYNLKYTAAISLTAALGGLLLGFDSAVISGTVPFIKSYFQLGNLELGWAVSSLILGAMLGNSMAGPLSDKISRKSTLIIMASMFILSALISALATDFTVFVLARILGGVGVGGAILIAPIYIAEIAPAEYRGRLVSFNQLNIVIGISLAYFSNYLLLDSGINNWRWMLGVETIPAVLYLFLLFFVPHSPRWLCLKNRNNEAELILTRIADVDYAKETIKQIEQSLDKEEEVATFKTLFQKRFRLVLFIGLALAFFQQITGINAIMYYAPTIFEQAGGGTESAFMQAVIVGLVNLGFTFVAIFLIDKLGRKPLLVFGTLMMAVALFLCSYAFFQAEYTIDDQALTHLEENPKISEQEFETLTLFSGQSFESEKQLFKALETKVTTAFIKDNRDAIILSSLRINAVLVLISILLFVAAFASSLGPVMWTLLSEIFPNVIRGMAISLVGVFNSLISFGITLIFPWEIENMGTATTFGLYGIMAVFAFIFAIIYVPETKGKSLEVLERDLMK